jgi:phosphate transport system protein
VEEPIASVPARSGRDPQRWRSDQLDRQIARLFVLVGDGLAAATAAFLAGDKLAASEVASADVVIDELRHDAESLIEVQLRSLVEATDPSELSGLVTALRVVPELERSGDLVEHIAARSSSALVGSLSDAARQLVAEMGEIAIELWRSAAIAFDRRDRDAWRFLRQRDDDLDDLHVRLCDELATLDLEVPVAIEMGLVARFFERLGDHAVNVARRVDVMPSGGPDRRRAGGGPDAR